MLPPGIFKRGAIADKPMAEEPDRARTPAEQNRIETRQWVEQVSLDPNLSPRAMQIAIFLAALIDRRASSRWRFWAYPSQALLARLVGITVRAVQNAIEDLVDKGHLERKKRSQTSSAYRPKLRSPHRSILDAIHGFRDDPENLT